MKYKLMGICNNQECNSCGGGWVLNTSNERSLLESQEIGREVFCPECGTALSLKIYSFPEDGDGWHNIVFNDQSERYSINKKEITCGTTLKLLMDGKSWNARVEHNGESYYAIIFTEAGKTFNVSLDKCMGKVI